MTLRYMTLRHMKIEKIMFGKMKFYSSLFLLILSSVVYAQNFNDIELSKKWLQLVDSGKYSETWREADSFFKQQITQEKWTKVINQVRTPLGKVISRRKINAKEFLSLPGAPDGKYLVLQFKTAFQNKKDAIETLTFNIRKEPWKVVGYFIK